MGCVDPLSTPLLELEPLQKGLSEQERIDRVEQLVAVAEVAMQREDYDAAIVAYEAAYRLDAGRHQLAYDIMLACYAGRRDKAAEYAEQFLTWADPESHRDQIAETKQLLREYASSAATRPPRLGSACQSGIPTACRGRTSMSVAICELAHDERARVTRKGASADCSEDDALVEPHVD